MNMKRKSAGRSSERVYELYRRIEAHLSQRDDAPALPKAMLAKAEAELTARHGCPSFDEHCTGRPAMRKRR